MYRLATKRQALPLSATRGYATSAGNGAAAAMAAVQKARQELNSRPRQPKPPQAPVDLRSPKSASTLNWASATKEDSLAGSLLRNTESGKNALEALNDRIAQMAIERRRQRLEREAQQALEEANSEKSARRERPAGMSLSTGNPIPIELLAGSLQGGSASWDSNGASDVQTWKRRDRPTDSQTRKRGDRPDQGGKRTPRASESRYSGAQSRKEREISIHNIRPTRETSNQEAVVLSEEDHEIDCEPEIASSMLPFISPDLGSIFRRQAPLHRPPRGDYAATIPPQTKDLYTTPVGTLPVVTQLQLAMAKSQDLTVPKQQHMARVVTQFVEVASSKRATA